MSLTLLLILLQFVLCRTIPEDKKVDESGKTEDSSEDADALGTNQEDSLDPTEDTMALDGTEGADDCADGLDGADDVADWADMADDREDGGDDGNGDAEKDKGSASKINV